MNSLIKSQLFGTLAVESAELTAVTEVTADDLPTENIEAESSSAQASDVVDVDESVTDLETTSENLNDASEGVEELEVAVEGMIRNGHKLSKIEAAALNLTLRQTVSRFVKDTTGVIPATEDFGGDAELNTTLAHEGLNETARAFGDGLVAAAKGTLNTFKKVVKVSLDMITTITSRANRVIARAKETDGSNTNPIKFNKANISVDGATDSKVLADSIIRLKNSLNTLAKAHISDEALNILEQLNKVKPGEKVHILKFYESYNKYLEQTFTSIFGNTREVDGKLTAKPFPGEYVPTFTKGDDKNLLAYESIIRDKEKSKTEKVELEAITPDEVIKLAGAVILVQESLLNFKGFLARQEATMKRMGAVYVEPENLKSEKENREDVGKPIKEVFHSIWNATNEETIFFCKLVSMATKTSINVLELCEKSLGKEKKTA